MSRPTVVHGRAETQRCLACTTQGAGRCARRTVRTERARGAFDSARTPSLGLETSGKKDKRGPVWRNDSEGGTGAGIARAREEGFEILGATTDARAGSSKRTRRCEEVPIVRYTIDEKRSQIHSEITNGAVRMAHTAALCGQLIEMPAPALRSPSTERGSLQLRPPGVDCPGKWGQGWP